jgi:alpha-tubulin suppressor-like RCC1 family protein
MAVAAALLLIACTAAVLSQAASVAGAIAPGVYSWGNNQTGELADGSTTMRPSPVLSTGLGQPTGLAIGAVHGLAMLGDGTVVAWGHNRSGELGDGSTADASTPVPVVGLASVRALAAGNAFSLAIRADGSVVAWGHNRSGELGDGTAPTDHHTAVGVQGLGAGSGVVALAAGDSHALALKADGTVLAWGNNRSGELGDGTAADHPTPVTVAGLGAGSGVIKIAAGGASSLALKADGTVLAWGNNQTGETGTGDAPTDHTTPVQVRGLGPGSGVVGIAAGFDDSYALKADGAVLAWGNNQRGETGSGDAPSGHSTPVAVAGLTGIVDIAAGWSHALALRGDGAVLAWGDNALGQIGDGTTTARSSPVEVSGLGPGSNAFAVFAGGNDSHALVVMPGSTPGSTAGSTTPGAGGTSSGSSVAGSAPGAPGAPGTSGPASLNATNQQRARSRLASSKRADARLFELFAVQAVGGGDPYGTPPTTRPQQLDERRAAAAMRAITMPRAIAAPKARLTGG